MMGLVPFQRDVRAAFCLVRVGEGGQLSTGKQAGPHWTMDLAGTVTIDSAASKTVRNKCLLFKPLVHGIVLEQLG